MLISWLNGIFFRSDDGRYLVEQVAGTDSHVEGVKVPNLQLSDLRVFLLQGSHPIYQFFFALFRSRDGKWLMLANAHDRALVFERCSVGDKHLALRRFIEDMPGNSIE